ncbi:MAG: ABC transporter permease [Ruminococcus sp.]|nr:ABC transporter permease [Ruminococcus sp.]
MRFRFKIRYAVLAAVNAAAIIGAGILTAAGSSMAKSQQYNYAFDRWKNGGKGSFGQVSCFFSDDAGFSEDSVKMLRSQIKTDLENNISSKDPAMKNFIDAYSSPPQNVLFKGISGRRTESELTAVGGNFFYFHNFMLLDGSYIYESDTMQDGVVVDESLAWEIYGSDDVAGMDIYIDGVKFYIAGVVQDPQTKAEKKCRGKLPCAYITYEGVKLLSDYQSGGTGYDMMMSAYPELEKINSYEAVLPDPVKNFAYNTIDKKLAEQYKGNIDIVDNAKRFSPSKRAKAHKKLAEYAIIKDKVRYPYWENASRYTEFRLTNIYWVRRPLFLIPCITLIWLVVIGYKALKAWALKKWEMLTIIVDRKRIEIHEKKKEKRERKEALRLQKKV